MSSSGQILTCEPTPTAALEQPQWYAIQTRPRHEKKVTSELEEKGATAYLPLAAQVHRWSDRHKVVHVPLFSCYVFMSAVLTAAVRLSVLRVWGVLGFVGPYRQGQPIPSSQIEDIRRLLASNTPFVSQPFLKIGQRVRIRGGSLDGIEGILVGCRGNRSLVISVEAIQRSLSIRIEGYDAVPI